MLLRAYHYPSHRRKPKVGLPGLGVRRLFEDRLGRQVPVKAEAGLVTIAPRQSSPL